ncbi:Re/Si-specific NAD(P)(+) transhydrogenase subunit alpha [Haladaptatus sp. F3-133]|jgi:NAD(P) transhydrogenase subunit alpha|uniref:proton-translocating NAD(P)(+) transhydrogenase n=1 Tax=Halorutilus salinus TaxID=2487751 RepID=A0A9Q4C3L3_9EURY|nr:Re/Si-specific NAD(P)(+) transhydrogenase subunit alpha [Halorutilus salinus]MCX2817839.1 Re/Si-specific NAD(P)(+) transhydrogenase subunit alpha [Halorutilus salinus]
MIIGVPGETAEGETRVALTPPVAGELVEDGHDVCVAEGAGEGADWKDDEYREAGCEVLEGRLDVFDRSDVVLHVRGLGADEEASTDRYSEGQVVVGLLGPYGLDGELKELADRNVSAFALELIPRISRAQSMDAVSSMDSVSGYRAITMAANSLPKMFPMEMTAAGTVQPAEVFVLGAGVAGLKAIATSERLGASTVANDVRPEVREEVESLGAEFVSVGDETEEMSDEEGYATEQEKSFEQKQKEMLMEVVPEADVVITTAAIPGRPAPQPITDEMIERMDPGSVVIDLAAESGGNCEPSRAGETVEHGGVEVRGPTNLPATIPQTASYLYSNNIKNMLDLLISDGEMDIDTGDEILDSTLLTHDGEVRAPHREDQGEDEDEGDENKNEEAQKEVGE